MICIKCQAWMLVHPEDAKWLKCPTCAYSCLYERPKQGLLILERPIRKIKKETSWYEDTTKKPKK